MFKNHRYYAATLITAVQNCLQYFVIDTINSNNLDLFHLPTLVHNSFIH